MPLPHTYVIATLNDIGNSALENLENDRIAKRPFIIYLKNLENESRSIAKWHLIFPFLLK